LILLEILSAAPVRTWSPPGRFSPVVEGANRTEATCPIPADVAAIPADADSLLRLAPGLAHSGWRWDSLIPADAGTHSFRL